MVCAEIYLKPRSQIMEWEIQTKFGMNKSSEVQFNTRLHSIHCF